MTNCILVNNKEYCPAQSDAKRIWNSIYLHSSIIDLCVHCPEFKRQIL